jgi:antitoxin (DNA-binding transcriptional repressor) of toxin-antitoxin stability system
MIINVRNLRQKLKEALDAADTGETVTIVRGDQQYRIYAMKQTDIDGLADIEKTPLTDKGVIPMAVPEIEGMSIPPMQPPASKAKKTKLCPHGNSIGQCFDKKKDRRCVE